MTLRDLVLSIAVLLSFSILRSASPEEKNPAKPAAASASLPELKHVLENKLLLVKALTKKRYWVFEEVSREMDYVETVTDRIRSLTHYQGEAIKPLAQSLFEQVVAIFEVIHQTAAHEMEALQIKAMDNEAAMESLLASDRWKELEITASMANYRVNKAKYYWALACPDNAPLKEKLLKEAVDGFLTSHTVVYQNAELTAYSFLIRALCLRELGNLEAAEKELDYLIHHGGKTVSPEVSVRARYEQAKNYLLAGKYHDCLQEATALLGDASAVKDDPDLSRGVEFLRMESSFRLLTSKENQPDSPGMRTMYAEALAAANRLIRANRYWQEKVFSTLTQEPVWKYLLKKDSPDPYVAWIVGEGLFYKNKFEEAIPFLKRALSSIDFEVFPGKGDLSFKLGMSYYNRKQFKEAIPCLAKSMDRFSRADTAEKAAHLLFKAYEQVCGEDWNQAYLKAITDYLKHYPQHHYAADAHYRLGKYYGQRENWRAALTELDKVSKESEHYLKAKFYAFKYRTEAFERLGAEAADTSKAYASAVRANNDFLKALREQGRVRPAADGDGTENNMMSQGALLSARLFIYGPEAKYRQGLKELSTFEQRYPHAKELFLSVGIVRIEAYQKLGEFAGAEAEVRRVMQSADRHPQEKTVLTTLAERLVRNAETIEESAAKESYKIAILIYEHLLPKSHQTAQEENLRYALASLHRRAGNAAQAKTMYQEIIKNDPHATAAFSGLAEICDEEKDYEQALEYWRLLEDQLTVGEPAWYEVKYKLAFTHDILGNAQRACTILTVTRKLHPDLGGEALKEKFLQLEKKVCSPGPH